MFWTTTATIVLLLVRKRALRNVSKEKRLKRLG